MLLQIKDDGWRANQIRVWPRACNNSMRHRKLPVKVLRVLRGKFSLGSTARSPQGGCHETQPYRNLIAGGSCRSCSVQPALMLKLPCRPMCRSLSMVGTTQLPAGNYRISTHDRNLVTISSANIRTVKVALYREDSPRKGSPRCFSTVSATSTFWAEIWGDENRATIDFPVSKAERQAQELQVASVPSNASKEVMIALK